MRAPEWIIVTGGVVAALGVIWRKVFVPVRGWFRDFGKWRHDLVERLEWVRRMMEPNSGSSLMDKVNDLTKDVAMLLEHDAERDIKGRRYGKNDPDEQQQEGSPP